MIKCHREIFSGTPEGRRPDIIYTYTVCPDGRYFYVVGANFFIRSSTEPEIYQESALWIYDYVQCKLTIFELNNEFYPGKLVDFYSINAKKCVLLMHNANDHVISQYLLIIDSKQLKAIEVLCRNWRLTATEAIRVGYGSLTRGCIVISGYTTPEFGNALEVRLLPADPSSTQRVPISLDRQIAILETLVKQHLTFGLYIWPGAVPLITEKGLYFLLARRNGMALIFETALIGAIEFLPDGQFNCRLIEVDDSALRFIPERELCINYVSMLAQRDRTCWLTAAVPAEPTHWRYKFQRFAVRLSRFLLIYFGTFFLWFSRYDGGRCAYWFGRFFFWMNGGRLMPNVGPNPKFNLFAFDLQRWRITPRHFQANCDWLRLGGQAMLDVENDGSAVLCESTQECDQFRITSFRPPFEPQPLRTESLNSCFQLYPRLRCQQTLRYQCGIQDFPML